jgi:hypothetical protein
MQEKPQVYERADLVGAFVVECTTWSGGLCRSTIRTADQGQLIDDAQIVERGRHDDLLERRGAYYRLYQPRFAPIEPVLSQTAGQLRPA